MRKWIKNNIEAIVLIIVLSLIPLLGINIAYYATVTSTVANNITTVVVEPNFTDVVSQSVKSVVHIKCPRWQGSGFIIDKHMIETARHVVDGVEDFTITLYDGTVYHATRAISSKDYDVATIWINDELPDECVAELGSIKGCKLGQDIFIIGSPFGDVNFNSVSRGII